MKKLFLSLSLICLTLPLNAVVIKLNVTITAHAKINALKTGGVREPISLSISLTGTKDNDLETQLNKMVLAENSSVTQSGNELSIPCTYSEKGKTLTLTHDMLTIDQNNNSATHALIDFHIHSNELLNIAVPNGHKIALDEDDVVLTLDYLTDQGFFFTES